MYFYFSSNYPAIIKLNGIYYGTIHQSIKSCAIDGGQPPFIEVCPLGGKQPPTCLILDEEFLSSPSERVSITDLKGGYLLKFDKNYDSQEFKVFAQQKFSDAVVTVFSENGYKISIETEKDFYAENLSIELSSAEIVRIERNKELIVIYLYGEKTLVNVYAVKGNINKLFSRQVEQAEFKDKFITVEKLNDIKKHKITTEWEYSGGKIIAKTKRVEAGGEIDIEKLNDKVLPFVMLEEFLAGGDYSEYLGASVLENADKLGGFFGEFIGVMPPPVFREIDQVGLIYNCGKNLYKVEYFKFQVEKGKIINVITC